MNTFITQQFITFYSFGSMLCPKILPLDLVTYNKLRLHQKCNVIVRYKDASDVPDFAYGEEDISSEWVSVNEKFIYSLIWRINNLSLLDESQ